MEDFFYNEYLDEGIRTFIKKRNYAYLKKIQDGSMVTSEELLWGFLIGAVPTVIVSQLIRSEVQKNPEKFKEKIERMKEELEELKRDKELDDEESKKTNKMILKITALNVLINNAIKMIQSKMNKNKL